MAASEAHLRQQQVAALKALLEAMNPQDVQEAFGHRVKVEPTFDDEMARMENASVTPRGGRRQSFADLLNIPLPIICDMTRPGLHIVLGPEQCNKTMVIAGIVAANKLKSLNRPILVVVNDMASNVRSVVDKLRPVLRDLDASFGVHYVAGSRTWADTKELEPQRRLMQSFMDGKTVLVCPSAARTCETLLARLQQAGAEFQQRPLQDMILVMDEADAMFTNKCCEDGAPSATLTKREQAFYSMLGATVRARPCPPSPVVSTLVLISATHLTTMTMEATVRQKMAQPPAGFFGYAMELPVLKAKGMTLYDDLKPLQTSDNQPIFVNPEDKMQAFWGRACKRMYREFAVDPRPGRMMLVALTATVDALSMLNVKKVAVESFAYMRKYKGPEPVVVIVGGAARVIATCHQEVPPQDQKLWTRAEVTAIPPRKFRRATTEEVLQRVEARYPDRPVIVVGSGVVKRSMSVRSDRRVITHIIAVSSEAKTSADVSQLLMRAGGETQNAREDAGFANAEGVKVLVLQNDYQLLQSLYEYTSQVLKAEGDGSAEGSARLHQRLPFNKGHISDAALAQLTETERVIYASTRTHVPSKIFRSQRATKRRRQDGPADGDAHLDSTDEDEDEYEDDDEDTSDLDDEDGPQSGVAASATRTGMKRRLEEMEQARYSGEETDDYDAVIH